jgi:hypothetical protein
VSLKVFPFNESFINLPGIDTPSYKARSLLI